MRTKCYSVRLQSLTQITPNCYKAVAFDGSEDLIPASQVFGQDWDVNKSEAYWISAWILERKNIQYSTKKEAWFGDNGQMLPKITYQHHVPERKEAIKIKASENLTK